MYENNVRQFLNIPAVHKEPVMPPSPIKEDSYMKSKSNKLQSASIKLEPRVESNEISGITLNSERGIKSYFVLTEVSYYTFLFKTG